MKRFISIVVVLWTVTYFAGCDGGGEVATPNARIVSILDNGGGVRFEWDPVDGADGYRVYVDGVMQYEGENTYFEWTKVAKEIKVVAYAGDKESFPKTFDFTPVISEIKIYPLSDPDTTHPSGFYFDASTGEAKEKSAKYPEECDYILDDVHFAELTLTGPQGLQPPFNNENNTVSDLTNADFDSSNCAVAPGGYYNYTAVGTNNTMYLWITDDTAWDDKDHFAKIYFPSSPDPDGGYTVKIAYQLQGGLRWLKTK